MSVPRCARRINIVTGVVTIIAISAMTVACQPNRSTNPGTSTTVVTQTATATGGAPTSASATQSAAPQGPAVVLPFTGLNRPTGVAVDIAGAVYVTDSGNNRVVKLAADSPTQTVPPITGLNNPVGIATDNGGNVYVTDANSGRVLWSLAPQSAAAPPWQAASSTEWVGPFTGLQSPRGVFMIAGQIFDLVDSGNNRVLHWQTGQNSPDVLNFTGLNQPDGMATDLSSNIWVTDTGNNRVCAAAKHQHAPDRAAIHQLKTRMVWRWNPGAASFTSRTVVTTEC